ncbi:MAG: hypothetical protein ACE5LA_07770 [Dehalococcoidales bacterium]
MTRVEAKTKLSPEEAIKRALEFFDPKDYGLEIKQQAPACAYFEGGGGSVAVTVCTEKGKPE